MANLRKRRKQPPEKTFEEVQKLVAEKGMKRSEAFREVGKHAGRSPNSVAVTYYRFASQKRRAGAAQQQPSRKAVGRRAAALSSDSAVSRVTTTLRDLEALVRNQQAEIIRQREEIAQLRKVSEQLEKARRALGLR